jgi:sugar lactone lactonase YvrE
VRRFAGIAALLGAIVALSGSGSANAAISYSNTGEFGDGEVFAPAKIAVDEVSGNVLVTEPWSNRVQVFDPDTGTALFGFGEAKLYQPRGIAVDQDDGGVLVTSNLRNESQMIILANVTGGTFRLSFEGQSTAPIPFEASGQAVRGALEGLSTIGDGNIDALQFGATVYGVTFQGALGAQNVGQISADASNLQGAGAEANVETPEPGFPGKIIRFTPDNRANPSSYAEDLSFQSPVSGPDGNVGEIGSLSSSIAIDPTNGDLFVADSGHLQVSRFSATGTFLGSFDGTGSTAGPFTSLLDLAVDSNGDVYVVADGVVNFENQHVSGSHVERFTATGSPVEAIGVPSALSEALSIAFDDAHGNLLVTTGGGPIPFSEPLEPPSLNVYAGGILVEKLAYPSSTMEPPLRIASTPIALAVDAGGSERVYALTSKVVFDSQGKTAFQRFVPMSLPVLDEPSAVTLSGAHLAGSVNPLGKASKYHFEYSSDDGSSWTSTPEGDAGSGSAPVGVAVDLTLAPQTTYLVRLVITSQGVSKASATRTLPIAVAPLAVTSEADGVTTTSSTLHGSVDPHGLASTYRFDYGPTATYGSQTPAASAGQAFAPLGVSQTITGLQPGTTYHYRLVAQSAAGATTGDDGTFSTAAVAPPVDPPRPDPADPSRPAAGSAPAGGEAAGPSVAAKPPKKKCGKGRVLRKIKGKSRCVKRHKQSRKGR